MKTIEITLFSYNELSEKAKEKALLNYQINLEYYGAYEVLDSLKAFFEEIGVRLQNYSIDWYCPNNSWIKYEGKPEGRFIKHNLTGVYFDYPLTITWNKTRDIEQSISALLVECANEYENQLSEETFIEYCEENEIYFDEKGNQF